MMLASSQSSASPIPVPVRHGQIMYFGIPRLDMDLTDVLSALRAGKTVEMGNVRPDGGPYSPWCNALGTICDHRGGV
jgi:hypothetical protein